MLDAWASSPGAVYHGADVRGRCATYALEELRFQTTRSLRSRPARAEGKVKDGSDRAMTPAYSATSNSGGI